MSLAHPPTQSQARSQGSISEPPIHHKFAPRLNDRPGDIFKCSLILIAGSRKYTAAWPASYKYKCFPPCYGVPAHALQYYPLIQ